MKKLLLALMFLAFAVPAHALTGKVLAIVCDKTGAAQNANAYKVHNIFAKCQEVQGWKYETCMASDTTFLRGLFPSGYAFSASAGDTSTGANYGKYDMAVMLNMPSQSYIVTDANCVTYGMPHFGQMIDRNSVWASPLPLLVPIAAFSTNHATNFSEPYTGIQEITAYTGTVAPFKDAQGDSLYMSISNNKNECLVNNSDTTGFSWVVPLMWRTTAARDATQQRYAHMWMTVGAGNHRVIWIPNADVDYNLVNWLTAFAMFTKVQPIEMPVIAYAFGPGTLGVNAVGADTVEYDAGFRRNVDYAVANGIKLELVCYPYSMSLANNMTNYQQAYLEAAAHPGNIRMSMSSGESWYPPDYYGILHVTGTYDAKINRIKYTQDSTGVYYPNISISRLDSYGGQFTDAGTNNKADSALIALATRDITDVYNYGTAYAGRQYPASATYIVLGPQRTWIKDASGVLNEMRFHPCEKSARYTLQEWDNPDWLKTAYYDSVTSNARRAGYSALYLNYSVGTYVYIDGATKGMNSQTAPIANKVVINSSFQAGMFLPAFTFCGGSKTTWAGASKATRRAAVDSTRSIFLDTMKQLNAIKRMGDYIVSTHGTSGSTPFKWAWLDEVKWDRRNGNQYPNGHVYMVE